MKMTKLFTTVFDGEMKSRGFKRKAKLYYRLNGDNLQGVVIKTVNPYSIHFYSAPYWMESIQADLFPLQKGYWAEISTSISPHWSARYYEENEQFNFDNMNLCFTLAKDHILPIMDKMNDLDSYIENCVPSWSGFGTEINRCVIEIGPDDVEEGYSFLVDFPIKMVWHVWDMYTYSAFLQYACLKGDLQKGYDLLEEKGALMPDSWGSKEYAQNKYAEFMTDDGLQRAEQYLADRRKIMLPRLRDELGLDTSGV